MWCVEGMLLGTRKYLRMIKVTCVLAGWDDLQHGGVGGRGGQRALRGLYQLPGKPSFHWTKPPSFRLS